MVSLLFRDVSRGASMPRLKRITSIKQTSLFPDNLSKRTHDQTIDEVGRYSDLLAQAEITRHVMNSLMIDERCGAEGAEATIQSMHAFGSFVCRSPLVRS